MDGDGDQNPSENQEIPQPELNQDPNEAPQPDNGQSEQYMDNNNDGAMGDDMDPNFAMGQ